MYAELLASSSSQSNYPLFTVRAGLIGCIVAGAFVLALAIVPLFRRTDLPKHGPRTLEIPKDVSPAEAAYIVHPSDVPGEAPAATVVDLAARGALEIVDLGGRRAGVRLTGKQLDGLTTYESMVFQLVQSRCGADQIVPAEALVPGRSEAAADGWRKGFDREVVGEAVSRGLVRRRYGLEVGILGAIFIPVLIGTAIYGFATSTQVDSTGFDGVPPSQVPDRIERQALMAVAVGLGVLALHLLGFLAAGKSKRLTPKGRGYAAALLGLADHLGADEHFEDAPAAAVAIWGRLLAYATGFGIASSVIRDLPLGPESDTRAWSDVTGQWRLLRVKYSKGRFSAWGLSPWRLLWNGLKYLVPIAVPVYFVAANYTTIHDHLITFAHSDTIEDIPPWFLLVLSPLAFILIVVTVRSLGRVLLGVASLFTAKYAVEGVAVRVRRSHGSNGEPAGWWVAVDDGKQTVLRAYRALRGPFPQQRQQVSLRVRKLTGDVVTLTLGALPKVAPPPELPPSASVALGADAAHLDAVLGSGIAGALVGRMMGGSVLAVAQAASAAAQQARASGASQEQVRDAVVQAVAQAKGIPMRSIVGHQ